jgi:DNA-binding response OmpR family regulator
MKILVLDDDLDFATGLAALIGQMGHDAMIAHDCRTARRLASDQLFDVILADVELPDGDGRHTCDGLRMDGASQTAYMVSMTGRSDLGDNDFPSFDGYMRKPVTYELLERVLEEWRISAGLDRQGRAVETQAPKAPSGA